MNRTRYRFSHRSGDRKTYYWVAERPVDSRYEHVSVGVEYFWDPHRIDRYRRKGA